MLIILEKLIAPILAFTAEEVWENIRVKKKPKSIHLNSWPKVEEKLIDAELEKRWDKLIEIRDYVLEALEKRRMEGEIGSSLEAKVELAVKNKDTFLFLNRYRQELPTIFIVSEVGLKEVDIVPEAYWQDANFQDIGILVKKSGGNKCNRCWNYSVSVGKSKEHPNLCQRCKKVINKL